MTKKELAAEVAALRREVAALRGELAARQPIIIQPQPYIPPYQGQWVQPYPSTLPTITCSDTVSTDTTVRYIGSAS